MEGGEEGVGDMKFEMKKGVWVVVEQQKKMKEKEGVEKL